MFTVELWQLNVSVLFKWGFFGQGLRDLGPLSLVSPPSWGLFFHLKRMINEGFCDYTGNGAPNPAILLVVALTHLHHAQMQPENAVCLQPSKKQLIWKELASLFSSMQKEYPSYYTTQIWGGLHNWKWTFLSTQGLPVTFKNIKLCWYIKMTPNAT